MKLRRASLTNTGIRDTCTLYMHNVHVHVHVRKYCNYKDLAEFRALQPRSLHCPDNQGHNIRLLLLLF